jgi:hypothetical protein
MMKRSLIIPILLLYSFLHLNAQVVKKDKELKREVTMYNPYKPSLPESRKKSYLPDMNDTMKVKPYISYDIKTKPFLPTYTISPIKPATLIPDPLPKLYKSFVNIGVGNYLTPLAEISITNERSKKGSIGFYGRHFSTNGKVELQNKDKVFAGYMDNDVSLFGKKFFRKSMFEGSVDYTQKTRYAYGYDTSLVNYSADKDNIRLKYDNIGAKASLSSLTLDSTTFSYDFDIFYNYFYDKQNLFQNNLGFTGKMAKLYKGFYVGSGIRFDHTNPSDSILDGSKYIASITPFIRKTNSQWSFNLGLQLLLDKNMETDAEFHLYPDINIEFLIVPSYVSFFAGLGGKLEKNDPLKIISDNPFLVNEGSLFKLRNTDHELILSSGLKGGTGLGGNYLVSASYSLVNDMLFYSNIFLPENLFSPQYGNYFIPLYDEVEQLNLHSEINGPINDKFSFNAAANYNHYTLAGFQYAWNKPSWDAELGIKYNLRDKIIAGMHIIAQGDRKMLVTGVPATIYKAPAYFNLNVSAEYRYSKILSLWTTFNNISTNRYYEWYNYPSQRFLFMLGFTYSL